MFEDEVLFGCGAEYYWGAVKPQKRISPRSGVIVEQPDLLLV
jgi:hypothetical protein